MTDKPTTVRDFSAAGPCITLGTFTKRTAKTIFYTDRHGAPGRASGYRVEKGLVHTEPCPSCRDHDKTQYPEGYMD